ncbi:unnamed protein product [Heterobilharzia americana]|nr:unnamed protein product [Heterobilharzia americana]
MTLTSVSQEAEAFKEEANKFFKDGEYDKAIEAYTKAIDICESAVYLANRSLAYLRTECFGYALDDASRAINVDSSYVKGYYRRASAHMALGQYKEALADYETVIRVAPSDKWLAFEQAIAVEDQPSPLESLDATTIAVEASYDGPHLEQDCNGKYCVTESFMLALMEYYKSQKVLHRKYALIIMQDIFLFLRNLPSLVEIDVPDETKFTLFNGDFVDRGSFSVECIFTLFGFKLLYPDKFYLSRGNHESEHMNRMYGFEGEVKSKYSSQMASMFTDIFNWLPLCHLINEKILVMHGGLFERDNVTLDEIKKVSRNRQPDEGTIMCELLWSDPMEAKGRTHSKRGVGYYIIRSHEVKDEGYEVAHNGRCITVFSAPNYCDTMRNRGAFITLKGSRKPGGMAPNFTSFKEVPHPDVRPMAYVNPLLSMFM